MQIESTRKLHDNKLTQFRVRDMRSDEILVVKCETAAECKTAERVAYLGKENFKRPDGLDYRIRTSYVDMAVTIMLEDPNSPSAPESQEGGKQ